MSIVSERLLLEPLVAGHARLLFADLQDPGLYTFIPRDPPASLASLEARWRRLESRRSPDGSEAWLNWVARRREGGESVGLVEATVAGETAHLAWTVLARFQRRGYGREACLAMIAHLRAEHAVTRFAAAIDTRNAASIGLVESLGFARVGLVRDADAFKGSTSHEYRYELAA